MIEKVCGPIPLHMSSKAALGVCVAPTRLRRHGQCLRWYRHSQALQRGRHCPDFRLTVERAAASPETNGRAGPSLH
jgi:hypothetical protein